MNHSPVTMLPQNHTVYSRDGILSFVGSTVRSFVGGIASGGAGDGDTVAVPGAVAGASDGLTGGVCNPSESGIDGSCISSVCSGMFGRTTSVMISVCTGGCDTDSFDTGLLHAGNAMEKSDIGMIIRIRTASHMA